MMTFRGQKLNNLRVPMTIIKLIGEINLYKGRQNLYKQQSPQILDALRQVAMVQSTEASNSIEGIRIKTGRLRQLMEEKTLPRNRSEGEIAGYRDVLATIHVSYQDIQIVPGVIQQLHRDLYKFSSIPGGRWKATDNSIVENRPDGSKLIRFQPVSAFMTPLAVGELCHAFNLEIAKAEIEPLVLTASFILDFLCIHPFSDGNGRLSRLLTLLLLYKFGFEVGGFISLEKLIEKSKESYYDTLLASSQGWHEGQHDLLPWLEYFLGIILAAYRELEERVGNISSYKGSKGERIKEAINHFNAEFTISDIERVCPDISRPTIYRVLKELKDQGLITPVEIGRNARWRKI
ncbi:MAG: Fic family protein [Bacillota bacterium]